MSLQNEFRPVGTRIYPVRRARISSNQAFQTASNRVHDAYFFFLSFFLLFVSGGFFLSLLLLSPMRFLLELG
jgi:hypothetical protein